MAKRTILPAGVSLRDGRYHVRATATDSITGHRRDRNRALPEGADLAQAVAVLEELRAQLENTTAPPARSPTLADYCSQWLARRSRRVRATTTESYARNLGHLLAALGHLHIDELERRHLVWYRDLLAGQDVAPATVRSRWRDARIVLRDALAEFDLPDRVARIEPPITSGGPRRQHNTLAREEVAALCEAADGRYAAMVRFMARTGCRLGEARGLRWCDLDLEARVARLVESITEVGGAGTGVWQVGSTKSRRARKVGLSADLVTALRAHLVAHPGVGEARVWATRSGGVPRHKTILRAMALAAQRAEIEQTVSPQVLRRTFDTIGLSSGVDRVVLQGMIGHAGDAMSAHYLGLRDETVASTVEAIWR